MKPCDGLAGRRLVEGLEVGRKLVLMDCLLLAILGSSLTGSTGLMLPDRASSDISREAGLNDTTCKCTGVPPIEDRIEHVDGIMRWPGCKR